MDEEQSLILLEEVAEISGVHLNTIKYRMRKKKLKRYYVPSMKGGAPRVAIDSEDIPLISNKPWREYGDDADREDTKKRKPKAKNTRLG